METSIVTDVDSYEALIQFLYSAPIGLVQSNAYGCIEMLNPMAVQLLMPLSEDGNIDNLFPVLERFAPELRQKLALFPHSAGVICESHRINLSHHTNGRDVTSVLTISLLKLATGGLMMVLGDATAEARREQQTLTLRLQAAAHTDNLTKLPNRPAVCEQLQHMLNSLHTNGRAHIAILYMNCDRLKQINDTLGHAIGDRLLRMLAARLRATLRVRSRDPTGGQTTAARVGGDEFVMLLDDMQCNGDVHSVASRIISVMAAPYHIDNHEVVCNVSIGVVMVFPNDPHHVDGLLQNANIAMAEAKRAGGARYQLFDVSMRRHLEQRGTLEADLRVAQAAGELLVHYQPVIALLPNGAIDHQAGVEALVRWRHPVHGMIAPLEFIGIAEECGLIVAIGAFVLEVACQDFMQWRQQLGAAAPRLLAVNLSRAQLVEPGLRYTVHDILERTGMPAEHLQLEITESLAAQNEHVQQRLHELKSLGLKLALDDFGTGYSSLACLHLLPVDTVKIDRSFVSHVDTSEHHRVLTNATVQVAHSLGMNTVAEGIETPAQAQVIRELGCDKGQGYLYSKPLSAADLVQWLAARAYPPLTSTCTVNLAGQKTIGPISVPHQDWATVGV